MKTGTSLHTFHDKETYDLIKEALDGGRIQICDNDQGNAQIRIGDVTLQVLESIDSYSYLSFYTHQTIASRIADYLDGPGGLLEDDKEEYDRAISYLKGCEYEYI